MDQYYYSNLKPSNLKPLAPIPKQKKEDYIDISVCEKNRESCNELIESKIKLSVLNLKLWIVTSVVLFLISTGGTFICAVKSYGKIEQRVDTITENQKALETTVESLRQEIWKLIPIGRSRPPPPPTGVVNNENNETPSSGTITNASR